MRTGTEDRVLAFGEKKFTQSGYFMQASGADMLSLKMIKGSLTRVKGDEVDFLSETLAKKLFEETDPINQAVTMDAKTELTVTGVYEDIP
ncbi:MAG: ABC transporter permease [Flammeovirgaceae bacterium]|nr:ABC transporter permease [Flammeovirgaceae bacterium]